MAKISVALCTYNGEEFLEEQLNSILNQTVSVDEIIVCDDCSTDKTIEILTKYSKNNTSLFSIYINEVNLKSTKNFEKAIGLTTGDYIFLADQDDVWKNDKVEKILEIFKQNPTAEGVFTNATFIDEKGNQLHKNLTLWDSISFFPTYEEKPINLFQSLTYLSNFLTGATLCIKKEVKQFCFPFHEAKNFIHDEWLALLLSNRNTLFYSTECLISYRLHQRQQLGVGNIKNPEELRLQNSKFQGLVLEYIKPRRFKDYKTLTRIYFSQYEKYKNLFEKYTNEIYKNIKDELAKKYIQADEGMKKCNFIRYYFRKRKDKKKNIRQL